MALPGWLKLSLAHLVFLLAICAYIGHYFPEQSTLAWSFACAGIAGEVVSWWRRVLIAEGLLIAVAVVLWWWGQPSSREAWHAYLGLLMASWLLVPSRLGWLRWLVPLAALEVLYLAINAPTAAIGRAAARSLMPLALGALATDAWLVATSGARISTRSPPPLAAMARWALIPAALAVLAGVWAGHSLSPTTAPTPPGTRLLHQQVTTGHPLAGLGDPLLGEPGTVELEPDVTARLFSDHEDALPKGMVYLRATAYDLVTLDGELVRWAVPSLDHLEPAPMGMAHTGAVWRAPSDDDVVLRPDGGEQVGLEGMVHDEQGNLYRTGLGDGPRAYRVSLQDPPVRAPADPSAYLGLPSRLELNQHWLDLTKEEPWEHMRPEDAAEAIATFLHERCRYSTTVPPPRHGEVGAIGTFAASEDPRDRVGHCQYFATAEALLLRQTGHPARLVVGFASTEHDGNSVTFRRLNAHAWVEFIDSDGYWRRIDPTPEADLEQAWAAAAHETLPPPPQVDPQVLDAPEHLNVPQTTAAVVRRHWPLVVLGNGALAGIVAWLLLRRQRRLPWRDPRHATLERRAEDLFEFARGMGVPIGPSSTVAAVSLELERRCGMDLAPWRDAHLAARYGTGPMPEPWPYARMRAGALLAAERAQARTAAAVGSRS